MERGVLTAVAALRWAAWIWLAAVGIANLHRVRHGWIVVAAIVLMGIVTLAAQAALTGWTGVDPLDRRLVGAELTVAFAAVLVDGWVRQGRITGQTLAGTWPLAAIIVVAVGAGPLFGAGAGLLLGGARAIAVVAAGAGPGQGGRAATATVSTVLLWIVVGFAAGTMIRVLRRTQDQLAEAAVRERMARDLHDGVLQTLALIERRSPSTEIAQLAREQERELRTYLFGSGWGRSGSLVSELQTAAARCERSWPDVTVTVTVTEDVPPLLTEVVEAAAGAAAEALTNAAKHGGARRIVVFADIDEASGGLFLSVKDDGRGFDAATVEEGVGMSQSIRSRVERAGGSVAFASTPGDGADVRMSLPAMPAAHGRVRRG